MVWPTKILRSGINLCEVKAPFAVWTKYLNISYVGSSL